MKLVRTAAVIGAATVILAGCSSGGGPDTGGGSSASGTGTGGKLVSGGTFTLAMSADPGNLDPQASAASNLFQITQFAYDNLVNIAPDGTIVSGLATKLKVDGTNAVLTLHNGITCSDGSAFTAADAAANLNYVLDPQNKSPFLGVFIPAGTKASADGDTLTLTTPAPAPFLLNGLGNVPMVCAKGLADRSLLAHKTDGTGAYELSDVASGDHYTYTKRSGYTWGPDGARTDAAGLPDKIVVKIVPNETTAANLLLSGGLNAATILGPDRKRLEAAHLFSVDIQAIAGEMWFNHTKGLPGADQSVREALVQALDLTQLAQVLTSGTGTPGTSFAATAPASCTGNSVAAALPGHDLAKAGQLLDAAGWTMANGVRTKDGKTLSLRFVYNSGLGTGGSAAAELAAQTWKKLGVKVDMTAQDETAITKTAFGTGDWDVLWESLNVSSPDQVVPFMSGAVPPDGTNFGHVDNPAYEAGVAQAAKVAGTAGCDKWLGAGANLVRDADVIPFANQVLKTFGSGAKFQMSGYVVPTSIRMVAD